MKKLMYLSLVGVMGLMMSCGGNNESEAPANDSDSVILEDSTLNEGNNPIIETPAETTEEATETKAAE
jgi:uncharacterized protein YcfL